MVDERVRRGRTKNGRKPSAPFSLWLDSENLEDGAHGKQPFIE